MEENIKKKNINSGAVFLMVTFILFAQIFSADDTTGQSFTRLLEFNLDEDSISSILNKYGKVKVYKDGDASESSTRITYYVKNENSYITFDSGEMGGGEIVTCFILRAKSNGEKFGTISDEYFSKTDLGGLKIGMKLIDFKKRIGKGCEGKINKIHKVFISKLEMTPTQIEVFKKRNINVEDYPFWDIVVSIIGTFNDSTLTQLNVCKTVTN